MLSNSRVSTMDSNQQQNKSSHMQTREGRPSRRQSAGLRRAQQIGLSKLITAGNKVATSALKAKRILDVQRGQVERHSQKMRKQGKKRKNEIQMIEHWQKEMNSALKMVKLTSPNSKQLGRKKKIGEKKSMPDEKVQIKPQVIQEILDRLDKIESKISNIQSEQRQFRRELIFLKFRNQADRANRLYNYDIELVESRE